MRAAVKKGRAGDLGEACHGGRGRESHRAAQALLARGRKEGDDRWARLVSETRGKRATRGLREREQLTCGVDLLEEEGDARGLLHVG